VQQGDALGPALFALAIHEVTSKILNIWYLDDGCIGGDCGGLEMAPHGNEWSPLDGAHE